MMKPFRLGKCLLRAKLIKLAFWDAQSSESVVGLTLMGSLEHVEHKLFEQRHGLPVAVALRKVLGPEISYFFVTEIIHVHLWRAPSLHRPYTVSIFLV
jgi:hypothetical protein